MIATSQVPRVSVFPPLPKQEIHWSQFRRPEVAVQSVKVAAADDTGFGGDFTSDPPEGSWPSVASIRLLGETFHIEIDEELDVVISHPKWSLMGYGATFAAAENMLIGYVLDLAETMVDDSPIDYTPEGNRLRVFAMGFLHLSSGK